MSFVAASLIGGGAVLGSSAIASSSSKGKGKGAGDDIKAAGEQAYQRAKQTGDESSQYASSFDLGKFLEQYYGGQIGRNAMPEGALSQVDQFTQNNPLNKTLYDQTLSQAQNPDSYYQSMLQPELMQAQDTINSYYQKRGLLNSGLAIESMGRAGVDLAIKEAQARMANRQQALQNASSLSQNIYGTNQNNLAGLSTLYSNQQASGLTSLNRQAGAAANSAQYQAYPAQAALGSYYGGIAAQQALPGQLIGAAGTVAGGHLGGKAAAKA